MTMKYHWEPSSTVSKESWFIGPENNVHITPPQIDLSDAAKEEIRLIIHEEIERYFHDVFTDIQSESQPMFVEKEISYDHNGIHCCEKDDHCHISLDFPRDSFLESSL